ncbi:MAG: NAD-dependent DNA ligase LigA [Bacteriovoracaceae bacterium]|nr:NAD-dependent DNA ligase LigA [Bacteriovoracaceae bacterium]
MAKQDKIKKLETEIIKHKKLYYSGNAVISDFEYDKLEEELKQIDPANPVLELVGTFLSSENKIQHDKKMLSLNKTYVLDDLIFWQDNKELLSTFKIDGSSCSIVYQKGHFLLGKTRGDGVMGENISQKILFLETVPQSLNTEHEKIEVRGEIYCTEENFLHLATEMEKRKLEKPNSQRNIVAGLVGRKENHDLCKYLSFQAFDVVGMEREFSTEVKKFQWLKSQGFEIPDITLHKEQADIEARLKEAQEFMSNGDYLIDGLVFSYNDLRLHEELGETAHHPRYKMAFKFAGEAKQTTIHSITWQISRNGVATPVAEVEPTELSGAVISRVTLHNYGMVKQFQLKAGDIIEIIRSGEVIPKFVSVVKSSETKFSVPSKCPSCSEKLYEEDIRLICKNPDCPDKKLDEILNFVKKVGIEDFSEKRIAEAIQKKVIKNIQSLYEINQEDLLTLEKVKDKLAQKIYANIQKSKEIDLVTFLSALGISGGAYSKSQKIVEAGFDTVEKILKLEISDLESIASFAEKSAQQYVESLKTKYDLIKSLLKSGVNPISQKIQQGTKLKGLKFCITGTLSMKRTDIEDMIKGQAGAVQNGVSSTTDYVITNDTESTSSKFKKAQELKIPIISEEKFLKLLND